MTIPISSKKSLVVYNIPAGQRKLHYVRENIEVNRGSAFVRVEDKSIKASKEVREIIRGRFREKNTRFHFGEKEKLLMQYLHEHGSITLNQFRQLANLGYYKASKTLIILVLANVLTIRPSDKGDIYSLKNNY